MPSPTKTLTALLVLTGCVTVTPPPPSDLDAAFRRETKAEERCRESVRSAEGEAAEAVRNGLVEDALRKTSASLATCERDLAPDHLDTARLRVIVAQLAGERGDAALTRAQAERALSVFTRAEGEVHGDTVRALEALQTAAFVTKDYAQARSLGLRIVAIREKFRNSTTLVAALGRLAFACRELGQPAEAIAALTRALEVVREAEDEHGDKVARVRAQLGEAYRVTGDLARAEPLLTTALADLVRTNGADAEAAVVATCLAALHYWGRQDLAKAEPLYRRALAIRVAHLPRGHVKTAETQVNLGALLCERGACAEGRALFDEGASVLERQAGRDTPELVRARARMGKSGPAR